MALPIPKPPQGDSEQALPPIPAPVARKKQSTPQPEVSVDVPTLDEDGLDEDGFKVDPRTGVKYRPLPKSEYDAEGIPILQIEDFDADNLNSEADVFLAHLRVGVSKEQKEEARRKRAERLSK